MGLTLEGEITSWNRGAGRLYGYPESEILNRPISILWPEDRPDESPGTSRRSATESASST